jgi:hypothetical protein
MKIFNTALTGYILITLLSSLSIANLEATSNRRSSIKDSDENGQCDVSRSRKSDCDDNTISSTQEDNNNTKKKSASRYDDSFKERKYTTGR